MEAEVQYENILYEEGSSIARITLNRPEKNNALNAGLLQDLQRALQHVAESDDVRVAVIKGAGRHFSAGYDLGAAPDMFLDRDNYQLMRRPRDRWIQWIWENPKPIVAQVHGFCLAGAGDMTSFCDITVASEDAVFGYPAIRFMAAPPTPWAWIIGLKKTKELLLTGNKISAQEAYDFGLVNRVVPSDRLEEEANRLAETIAKVSPRATFFNKLMVNRAFELMNIQDGINNAHAFNTMLHNSRGGDEFFEMVKAKGLRAALAWRDAQFRPEFGDHLRKGGDQS